MFHVSSNKHVSELKWLLVSSGHVTGSGSVDLQSWRTRSWHLALTTDMYPVSTLIVWHIDIRGKMLAEKLTFPVFQVIFCCLKILRGKLKFEYICNLQIVKLIESKSKLFMNKIKPFVSLCNTLYGIIFFINKIVSKYIKVTYHVRYN